VVASQICEIPLNSPQIRLNTSRSCNVIDLSANRERYATSYQSLIVTFDVSPIVLEILTHLARIYLVFTTPPLFDAPIGGTPCDINIIYTPQKRTFNGLQFRR